MKKLLIYGGIVILLFISLAVVSNMQQTQKSEGNPFGKDKLRPATIDLMDDPNYQNVILPEELTEKLSKGEEATIYFYSSECSYCKETTPRLAPLAKEIGVDLRQYNVLEFEQGWKEYQIESTPTVIHFEDGKEKERLEGAASNAEFTEFFNEYVLKK